MKSPQIKALAFDLGEVLIKLDFSQVMKLRHLKAEGVDLSIASMNRWSIYDDFERGELGEKEFLEKLNAELSTSLTLDSFRVLWNSVLKESIPGIETILKRLSIHYPLWALTNSNETHIHHFRLHYPWHTYFQAVLTSFELGCRKPEPTIYKKLIHHSKFPPQNILFLDDREENVLGARALGIHAEICKDTPKELPKILADYSIHY